MADSLPLTPDELENDVFMYGRGDEGRPRPWLTAGQCYGLNGDPASKDGAEAFVYGHVDVDQVTKTLEGHDLISETRQTWALFTWVGRLLHGSPTQEDTPGAVPVTVAWIRESRVRPQRRIAPHEHRETGGVRGKNRDHHR